MQQSRAITRKSASNLALAFCLLPKTKRDDMSALYAFCREVDDVADEDAVPVDERRVRLAHGAKTSPRLRRGSPQFAVNRELQPAIEWYHLRFELFDDLIRGCEMDLETKRYDSWEQLDLYCHRVASVVGLLSIEIFGYAKPASRDYAVALGKALQLTNILRDVKTDAARGRIYLPLSELEQAGVGENVILSGKYSERYHALANSITRRAKHFYRLAGETLPPEDRPAMVAAELMGAVYWRLLCKLEHHRFDVFGTQRVRLGNGYKLLLILRTWYRFASGAETSDYGPG